MTAANDSVSNLEQEGQASNPGSPHFAVRTLRAVRAWLALVTFKDLVRLFNYAITIIPSVSLFALLLWQSGVEIFDRSLSLQPLSVPKSLADDGYTPDVVAQKLNDSISLWMAQANTSMKHEDVSVGGVTQDVITPNSGSSIATLVSAAMHFLHLSARTYVTGEITKRNGQLWLTLRMGGHQTALKVIGPKSNPEDLFDGAAREILWQTQPYIVAIAETNRDEAGRKQGIADLDLIIRYRPRDDLNVARALNLRGMLHHKSHRDALAEADYRAAIAIDPRFLEAHENYGNLLRSRRNYGAAIAQYNLALAADGTDAFAQIGLGAVYFDMGRNGEALEEYRLAGLSDPRNGLPHDGAGNVLFRLGKYADAAAEFSQAVALSPNDAGFREDLGDALFKLDKLNEAITAYRRAVALDSRNMLDLDRLAMALSEQGSRLKDAKAIGEAIALYRGMLSRDPARAATHADLALALQREFDLTERPESSPALSEDACKEMKLFHLYDPKSTAQNVDLALCGAFFPGAMAPAAKPPAQLR